MLEAVMWRRSATMNDSFLADDDMVVVVAAGPSAVTADTAPGSATVSTVPATPPARTSVD